MSDDPKNQPRSVSFTLPADFDPKKPLRIRVIAPLAPAFDPTPYAIPKDPDDPDSGGGLDPDDPSGIAPNPNGGLGGGPLSGTGSLSTRLNAVEDHLNALYTGTTIGFTCNEDTTATVTITFGTPPLP